MKDFVEVYKRVGKVEYVIHTTLNPRGTTAVVRWYVRTRPFHGATKINIIKEGSKDTVSLVKGNYKANDLWQLKRRHYVNEIDEYIKNNPITVKEDIGEEVEKKPEVKKEIKAEVINPFNVPKKQIVVKDVEE